MKIMGNQAEEQWESGCQPRPPVLPLLLQITENIWGAANGWACETRPGRDRSHPHSRLLLGTHEHPHKYIKNACVLNGEFCQIQPFPCLAPNFEKYLSQKNVLLINHGPSTLLDNARSAREKALPKDRGDGRLKCGQRPYSQQRFRNGIQRLGQVRGLQRREPLSWAVKSG